MTPATARRRSRWTTSTTGSSTSSRDVGGRRRRAVDGHGRFRVFWGRAFKRSTTRRRRARSGAWFRVRGGFGKSLPPEGGDLPPKGGSYQRTHNHHQGYSYSLVASAFRRNAVLTNPLVLTHGNQL